MSVRAVGLGGRVLEARTRSDPRGFAADVDRERCHLIGAQILAGHHPALPGRLQERVERIRGARRLRDWNLVPSAPTAGRLQLGDGRVAEQQALLSPAAEVDLRDRIRPDTLHRDDGAESVRVVRHPVADPMDTSIVRALVEMAHALGLEVTAEWVETSVQAERLAALGCDVGQGRWFGDAGPGEWVPGLWRRRVGD